MVFSFVCRKTQHFEHVFSIRIRVNSFSFRDILGKVPVGTSEFNSACLCVCGNVF